MSLGAKGHLPALRRAIDDAVDAGVTVVVAAGNQNDDACKYTPAVVTNAITVGATTTLDHRSGFSNYGTCVDIFAPGSAILSAYYGCSKDFCPVTSDVIEDSGTSMACPAVAGAAAVLLGRQPSLKPAEIKSKLLADVKFTRIRDVGPGSPNKLLFVSPTPAPSHAPTPAPISRPTPTPTTAPTQAIPSADDLIISGSVSASLGPLATACVVLLLLTTVATAPNSNESSNEMLSGSGSISLGRFEAITRYSTVTEFS